MPIYEYYCRICQKEISFFGRNTKTPLNPYCSTCGGIYLVSIISNFAIHKSTKTIYEESGDPTMSQNTNFYKDPRNIGRWAENKFQTIGMEMPTEIRENIKLQERGNYLIP